MKFRRLQITALDQLSPNWWSLHWQKASLVQKAFVILPGMLTKILSPQGSLCQAASGVCHPGVPHRCGVKIPRGCSQSLAGWSLEPPALDQTVHQQSNADCSCFATISVPHFLQLSAGKKCKRLVGLLAVGCIGLNHVCLETGHKAGVVEHICTAIPLLCLSVCWHLAYLSADSHYHYNSSVLGHVSEGLKLSPGPKLLHSKNLILCISLFQWKSQPP